MKTIAIISTYINKDINKEKVLINIINQFKKIDYDIMLISHAPIRKKIVNLVNYYIYDSDNRKLPYENTAITWFLINNYRINKIASNHSYAIMKNITTSLYLSSFYGYENFIYTEYDMNFHEDDLYKIKNIFHELENKRKKCFFFKHSETSLQTLFFLGNIKFFIDNFKLIKNYEDWFITEYYVNNNSSLEEIIFKQVQKFIDYVEIENSIVQYFEKSKINIYNLSNGNLYPIVYNLDNPKKPKFFIVSQGAIYRLYFNYVEVIHNFVPEGTWINKPIDLENNESINVELYVNNELVFHRILNNETIEIDKKYSFLNYV